VAGLSKSDIHFSIIGNDQSAKAIGSFKKNIGGTSQMLSQLRNQIVAAFGVREIVNAANVMIGVENRMNALTGSAEKTAIAMNHMRRIASDSRSDFDAVAMLYTRLSLATEHLGATQRDVADATQTVANTFIIAGSHAQEANNSARQLAQGLASGALRGDELRSVMENNTILTKMLADGLGKTIGELREFGHAGKLTAEVVMPILIAGMKETNEQITKMPMTLGQAGVAIRNNFQFIIADVQKATNGFSGFASVVGKIANNLDALLIPAVVALGFAIPKVTLAIKALSLAMYANPITAFIAGFAAILTAAYIFRSEIKHVFTVLFEQTLPNLFDGFAIKMKELQKIISFGKKDAELQSEIEALRKQIEVTANKEIKKMKVPSFMDMLLGRDPNAPAGNDGSGFKMLTPLEQFLKSAEDGFSSFYTGIKTMQDEMQNVFQKSYDGLTDLTMQFLETGKASFKDYATSIVRELIRIAVQKLIIDRMFGSIGGSLSSFRDRVKSGIEYNNLTDGDTLFGRDYDGGGYTGMGARAGGMDGKGGFPAMLHPNETVVDHTKGQSMGGATVNFNISTVDAAGFDQLLASRKGMITAIINQAMNSRGKMGVV
jgi:tape measure domain-containing protein